MTARPRPGRRGWWAVAILVPLGVAAVVTWQQWPDEHNGGATAPDPVEVAAAGPRFTSLDDLVAASDLVVVARVTGTSDGRTITDPADPAAGLRTGLATLDVERVLAGDAPEPLVVEYEAALLDGTPIRVGGIPAPAPGDHAVYFLIEGETEEFPYFAVVGPQGWYALDGERLTTTVDDDLAGDVAALTLADLAARI